MTELELQRELVKAALAEGGHAFKMSHRFLSGVVDLFIKLPVLPVVLIECKIENVRKKSGGGNEPVNLTALQRKFIRDHQRAGGIAGWLVAVRSVQGTTVLYSGVDPDAITVTQGTGTASIRLRGAKWPIRTICERIIDGNRAMVHAPASKAA